MCYKNVTGWGALIPEDVTGPLISILVPEVKRPSVLQVVNVPVITNDKCERWHHDQGIEVLILISELFQYRYYHILCYKR